jgi:copper chaperone CopZ
MQRLILVLVAALPVALGTGCRQQDLRTVTIVLSGVSGGSDVQSVSNAIARLDGVFDKSITFHDTGSVTVRYDSMKLARKNIEYAVVEAGFGANDIPAKRRADTVPVTGAP